jgi:hypothetical protein
LQVAAATERRQRTLAARWTIGGPTAAVVMGGTAVATYLLLCAVRA